MNKKTKITLLIIYVLAIFSMITSATMAFFTYINVSNVSPVIDAQAATILDWLTFDVGKPIYILANDYNFGKDMGNLTSDISASATLKVESDGTVTKTYYYNLKLEIKDNEFIYTTPDEKAELLIKVIDPNGEELTEIPGLEYVESQGYKGFDITTKNGDFYIAQNYEISTNSLVVHNWKVEVTLVNLDTNQYMNIGNDFNGVLKMESVRGNG